MLPQVCRSDMTAPTRRRIAFCVGEGAYTRGHQRLPKAEDVSQDILAIWCQMCGTSPAALLICRAVLQDARQMAQKLETLRFSTNGSVWTNLDLHSLRAKVTAAIRDLQDGDIFFYFFAGHGKVGSAALDVSMAAIDATHTDNFLSLSRDIIQPINQTVRHAVIIAVMDCCRCESEVSLLVEHTADSNRTLLHGRIELPNESCTAGRIRATKHLRLHLPEAAACGARR